MFAKSHVIGDAREPAVPAADRGGRRAGVELQQGTSSTAAGGSSRASARGPSRTSPELAKRLDALLARAPDSRSVRTRTYVRVVMATTRIPPRDPGRLRRVLGDRLAARARRAACSCRSSTARTSISSRTSTVASCAIQVKTSTVESSNGRFDVTLATRGGNQSWSGVVKNFSPAQCDYLFVHVGGRAALVHPVRASVEGGDRHHRRRTEVRRLRGRAGRPAARSWRRLGSLHWRDPGGVPERSKGTRCKRAGSAFAGSNPAPAIQVSRRPGETCAPARCRLDGSRRRVEDDGDELCDLPRSAAPPPEQKESVPMESSAPARVLIVAHRTAATPALQNAVRERAAAGPAIFTLLVPNSAHGLHRVIDPEDNDRAEAGAMLELALPLLEEAAGSRDRRHHRRPQPVRRDPGRDQPARLRRDHHLDAADARLALAAQRPAEQAQRARAAGDDDHGRGHAPRDPQAEAPSASDGEGAA